MSTPDPYWTDGESVTLYLEDCLAALTAMDAASIDAICTDPPYALGFMGKTWDSPGAFVERPTDRSRRWDHVGGNHNPVDSADAARTRRVEGQRFQRWCEQWAAECLRVLKPGGYMLAFGGTRTWHRLVCGIEDAGFEIRDGVASLTGQDAPGLMWIHGQGFPKSHDVAKAIDKVGGVSPEAQGAVLRAARERAGLSRAEVAERVGCKEASVLNWEDGRARAAGRAVEYITPSPQYRDALADLLGYTADERRITGASPDRRGDGSVIGLGHSGGLYATDAATEAAKDWEGWGTALKPAWEPIVVARKPMRGTVAANVLEFGTGALNIGGCKVAHASEADLATSLAKNPGRDDTVTSGTYGANRPQQSVDTAGRWPTNLVFTHSASCEPTGTRRVRNHGHGPASRGSGGIGTSGHRGQEGLTERREPFETVEAWSCAPDCPVGELDRQSGSVKSSGIYNPVDHGPNGNATATSFPTPGLPGTMYGDTGGASRFFPVFQPEYEQMCALYGMLSVCERVSDAGRKSPPSGQRQGSAASVASASLSRPSAGRPDQSTLSAPTAGSPSGTTPATVPSTARATAQTRSSDWSAPHVRSAGSLCGSCATAIAQSLAATQHGQSPMPTLGLPSTDAFSERILTQNLALFAEALERRDTTSTTTALTTSLGCVVAAISACITRESGSETRRCGRSPFKYAAKAPVHERPRLEDGAAHPTVKPVDLMAWLVRLVTPPGGLVLDPFAGSGTTAEACIIEGFRCILIEQDPKSCELIKTRLSKPIQPTMLTVDDSAHPARPHPVAAASRPKPVPEAHPSLFDDLDAAS